MARISAVEKPENAEAKRVYSEFTTKGELVPEWVKVMAHSPNILKEFHELFKVVMAEGALDSNLKWRVAHAVSEINRCEFCVDVTKQMLESMGAEEGGYGFENASSKKDKLLFEIAVQATTHSAEVSEELFNSLKEEFNEEELIELISVIGLFNYINRYNNSLLILP